MEWSHTNSTAHKTYEHLKLFRAMYTLGFRKWPEYRIREREVGGENKKNSLRYMMHWAYKEE